MDEKRSGIFDWLGGAALGMLSGAQMQQAAAAQQALAQEQFLRSKAAYEAELAKFKAKTEGQKWGEAEDAEFIEIPNEPALLEIRSSVDE
jgi:hypothetical protein